MSEVTISKERINYTIDLLITMVTEEIAEETGSSTVGYRPQNPV